MTAFLSAERKNRRLFYVHTDSLGWSSRYCLTIWERKDTVKDSAFHFVSVAIAAIGLAFTVTMKYGPDTILPGCIDFTYRKAMINKSCCKQLWTVNHGRSSSYLHRIA